MPIDRITIHEGYNDLGTFELDITDVKQPANAGNQSEGEIKPEYSRKLLFKLQFDGPTPVPTTYLANFTAEGLISSEDFTYQTLNPNSEGFIEIETPVFPVVNIDYEFKVIRYKVSGPLDARTEECYLEVEAPIGGTMFTLITDFVVDDGKLCVTDGNDNYFPITPNIAIDPGVAIHITKTGEVFEYDTVDEEWESRGSLLFHMFQYPENLTSIEDGFYDASSAGTDTDGTLGETSTPFEDFYGDVLNPEVSYVDITLEVLPKLGAMPQYSGTMENLLPGTLNFIPVTLTGSPPAADDNSPTWEDIETITGISFSVALETFLTTKELTTVDVIRQAGPMTYIEDFPEAATEEEVKALQAHVDFYSINQDAEQNQLLLDANYFSVMDIANTPKDVFINSVLDAEDLPLFQAAKIHEIAIQNQKMVSNYLSATLSDLTLSSSTTPIVPDSTFAAVALHPSASVCGCSDCKSGLSPFAYLMDLLKYAAAHIDKTAEYEHGGTSAKLTEFIELMQTDFYQPFGTMNVSCETLHDEFCRVRLVTEVLEKIVIHNVGLGFPPPTTIQSSALTSERKQFLQLTYKSILTQAGTSIEEVRNVFSMPAGDEKFKAAKDLASKIGIPVYIPTTTNYTTDKLWLSFQFSMPSANALSAENLETVFGFRNTLRDVLTPTPTGYVQEWREVYLRQNWSAEDYVLSDYSREAIDPSNPATFKENWKPIVDPDITSWTDFTYLVEASDKRQEFIKNLWSYRKDYIDSFLTDCLASPNISRTSADMFNRILKVEGVDITGHVIETDVVQIEEPSSTWNDFNLKSRSLVGTNTDVVLKKSTPSSSQPTMQMPYGATPKMRYKRVLNVISGVVDGNSGTFSITCDADITNKLSGGYVKLTSTSSSTVFETGGSPTLSAGSPTGATISITVGSAIPAGFDDGTIKFYYTVEVPLYTDEILDPVEIVDTLFTDDGQTYTLFDTTTADYTVWETPSPTNLPDWPTEINASSLYGKLKQVLHYLSIGTEVETLSTILEQDLHITKTAFSRMMQLLGICEKYLASMYTDPRPTQDELYELTSIFFNCAKNPLRGTWVAEEIEYDLDPTAPVVYANIQLSEQYFWRSISEPVIGTWDPRLQDPSKPFIDPELLSRTQIVPNPEANDYRATYDVRVGEIQDKYDEYIPFTVDTPFNADAFNDMLNDVNQDSPSTPFDVSPFADLDELIEYFESNDVFKQKEADDVLLSAFTLTREQFALLLPIKRKYEQNDPTDLPSTAEIDKAVKILVSAYKRMWYYPDWITDETTDNVKYYNVISMNLAPGRGFTENRNDWQETLNAWNRIPTIQPDIVSPESIKNFVTANWVYTAWNDRNFELISTYTVVDVLFNSTLDGDVLFANLKDIIGCAVGRMSDFSTAPTYPYIDYFLDIVTKEDNDEDIRPYVAQFGMTVEQYRYLKRIYQILEQENTAAPSSLMETEFEDTINILLRIQTVNLSYNLVVEEYDNDIVLDQDYFQIYKPISNFPVSDLPVYNKWRSPQADRKKWSDTLENRIKTEVRSRDKWKDILQEAEDRNMPLMRDALIRALTNDCENWRDAAERLAKTFFIETKDNCCVKHTRVSFALETIQGLIWALQTGIYDDFISDYSLIAPNFKQEWQWMGSYSTWKSARFVYYYPENILYPTLKRLQSPAFRDLAAELRTASSFSPEDACHAALTYQQRLEDIENMEVLFSTSGTALVSEDSPLTCCDDGSYASVQYTYFFGQGPSGKKYWTKKKSKDQSREALEFWEELVMPRKDISLLGCIPYSKRDSSGVVMWQTLFLYYSYFDNGLKLAYIKKDIFDPNSEWTSEKITTPIPAFGDTVYNSSANYDPLPGRPYNIMACQTGFDSDVHAFIVSQDFAGKGNVHGDTDDMLHQCLYYNPFDDTFSGGGSWFINKEKIPVAAIRHVIFNNLSAPSLTDITDGITVFFTDKMYTSVKGLYPTAAYGYTRRSTTFPKPPPSSITDYDVKDMTFIAAYESGHFNTGNPLIIFFKDKSNNNFRVGRVKIDGAKLATSFSNQDQTDNTYQLSVLSQNNVSSQITQITKYCPIFFQRNVGALSMAFLDLVTRVYAFRGYHTNLYYGSTINYNAGDISKIHLYTDAAIYSYTPPQTPFALLPLRIIPIPIQSAECVTDMSARQSNIAMKMKANMDDVLMPLNITQYIRPSVIREYEYEAFYFVPMLLALDQQRRGQYSNALAWYRTVYDYTRNVVTNRKIFYGLVLEKDAYNLAPAITDWLKDPLNPHAVAATRINAYTKYTIMSIVQCLYSWADREFTMDTVETVPNARKLYTVALDLIYQSELNVKANLCIATANYCLDTKTNMPATENWMNLYKLMKQKLAEIGDPDTIETLSEEIAEILNESTEDTFAADFAEIFEMIEDAMPDPPAAEDVAEVVTTSFQRMADAYRYVTAIYSPQTFNASVSNDYALAVSQISDIALEDIESEEVVDKLTWLTEPTPANSAAYQFKFATPEGDQYLSTSNAFDPTNPFQKTIAANLDYSNANSTMSSQRVANYGPSYVPLIDFKFCTPKNPIYEIMILKGNLETFKIHNCRNIAGIVRELDVFAASTDSASSVPFIGATGNLTLPGAGTYAPSQYRFRVLLERAKTIAQQAQQMESMFLSAIEKEDAETYNRLRATQDIETSRATIKLQDLRIAQATSEVNLAATQLSKVGFIQNHYEDLIAIGLSGFEMKALDLMKQSVDLMHDAQTAQAASGVVSTAVNIATLQFGAAVSAAGGALSGAISAEAGIASAQAGIIGQMASYQRREQDWKFQRDLAGFDILISNQQIRIAEDNVRITGQERAIAVLNTDHAEASLEFLKNKFTNAELYNWMGGVLEKCYNYMLNLATAIGRTAEKQLYFERQEAAGPFILDDYWETPTSGFNAGSTEKSPDRRGLTGSARLLVDITRLEQHAMDTNKRKFQMTKTISLAQNFPTEFQLFKQTGVLNFELTDRLFDYDFPGNYLRLVNGVKTTVVGLLPVYDMIKATLSADTISYTVIGGNSFQKIPIRRLELDSVALTSPTNSTGIFELQPMQGELLNPFEGMGIESRWEFKMPKFSNRMDFDNIADIVLNVEYTALDNTLYRSQVLEEIGNEYLFNRGFSLKNNFPDQWYDLAEVQEGTDSFEVTLDIKREFFPQGITDLAVSSSGIKVYFVREDGFEEEIKDVDINLENATLNLIHETVNGVLVTNSLDISVGDSPIVKLKLGFDNNPDNRELFTEGKVRDILLLFGCTSTLNTYPL